jgi:hypothetical protein
MKGKVKNETQELCKLLPEEQFVVGIEGCPGRQVRRLMLPICTLYVHVLQ